MDGASNNWIARKAIEILKTINPYALVIHWSYTQRRELTINQTVVDHYEFDEERRQWFGDNTEEENLQNLVDCCQAVESANNNSIIIHSVIPEFVWEGYNAIADQRLKSLSIKYIPEFKKLDLARDGCHYDILTSQYFVDKITKLLDY